jgi:hypothetical protein
VRPVGVCGEDVVAVDRSIQPAERDLPIRARVLRVGVAVADEQAEQKRPQERQCRCSSTPIGSVGAIGGFAGFGSPAASSVSLSSKK